MAETEPDRTWKPTPFDMEPNDLDQIAEVLRRLGLDRSMTVPELQHRLAIAERVEGLSVESSFPYEVHDARYGRWLHNPTDLLRWIKRPNEDPTEANNMFGYPEGNDQ